MISTTLRTQQLFTYLNVIMEIRLDIGCYLQIVFSHRENGLS